MTFDEYQTLAMKTAIHKSDDFVKGFLYRTLGMMGEAGEVAEKVKKIVRDKDGAIDDATRDDLVKEMGDVLWYLQALGDSIGVPLEEIAQVNIDKLASRHTRGQLQGSGDNR